MDTSLFMHRYNWGTQHHYFCKGSPVNTVINLHQKSTNKHIGVFTEVGTIVNQLKVPKKAGIVNQLIFLLYDIHSTLGNV